jgi:hypothetical protein
MKHNPAMSYLTRVSLVISIVALGWAAAQAGNNFPKSSSIPTVPPEWHLLPDTHSAGILSEDAVRRFYPTLRLNRTRPVFFILNGGKFGFDTALTLSPNTRYRLVIGVGTRRTGHFAGFRFTIESASGIRLGEWIGANRNFVPPGGFADFSRSFISGPNLRHPGEKLRITISQPEDAPANAYTDVQDIRLTAEPAERPHPAGQPMDVFIVAGQSNAHGWKADACQLSADNQRYVGSPNPLALLTYKERNLPDPLDNTGTFAMLVPQGPGFAANFNGFGPELSLGIDLADSSRSSIAIIKYAIGSAGLNADFRKPANRLYPTFTTFVATAQQQLREQGFDPTLRAVFWLQGETDTSDHPAAYGQNITDFVHDLRNDLNAPSLKFYLTEINPNMPVFAAIGEAVGKVNQGMKDLAGQDPLVRFVSTGDITSGFADPVHYSADQEISIGQRWAKAYRVKPNQ